MRAVFHLLAILVKVVLPLLINTAGKPADRKATLQKQVSFTSGVRLGADALPVNLGKHAATVLLLHVNNILQSNQH